MQYAPPEACLEGGREEREGGREKGFVYTRMYWENIISHSS
jgi:hypothetical protein